MAPAAPFNPPSPNLPGKPHVDAWVPPPVTKDTSDFAKLQYIDLSKLDSDDPSVVAGLVDQVKTAIREDGFLFLQNYGISYEQVSVCTPGSCLSEFEYDTAQSAIFLSAVSV